jgi:hypothetical protein
MPAAAEAFGVGLRQVIDRRRNKKEADEVMAGVQEQLGAIDTEIAKKREQLTQAQIAMVSGTDKTRTQEQLTGETMKALLDTQAAYDSAHAIIAKAVAVNPENQLLIQKLGVLGQDYSARQERIATAFTQINKVVKGFEESRDRAAEYEHRKSVLEEQRRQTEFAAWERQENREYRNRELELEGEYRNRALELEERLGGARLEEESRHNKAMEAEAADDDAVRIEGLPPGMTAADVEEMAWTRVAELLPADATPAQKKQLFAEQWTAVINTYGGGAAIGAAGGATGGAAGGGGGGGGASGGARAPAKPSEDDIDSATIGRSEKADAAFEDLFGVSPDDVDHAKLAVDENLGSDSTKARAREMKDYLRKRDALAKEASSARKRTEKRRSEREAQAEKSVVEKARAQARAALEDALLGR